MRRLLYFIPIGLLVWPCFMHEPIVAARDPASLMATKKTTDTGVHVVALSPDFPIEDLRRDGYRVDGGTENNDEPDPKVRDEIFRKVGAWPFASRLDHLDRSFLFLRAREYSPSRFGARYPVLHVEIRKRLQKVAKGREWLR